MIRPVCLLLMIGFVAESGCTPAPPLSRSAAAARTACRAESEASFNRQNRDLLSTRDTTDTPFSSSGVSGITTAGLSREYARESMLDDCLQGNNAGPPTAASTGSDFRGPAGGMPSLPAR